MESSSFCNFFILPTLCMKEKTHYNYILSNQWKAIYVGVTNNLLLRLWEHKQKINPLCFTAKYSINRLVYFEETNDILGAIKREKQLKSYKRQWKVDLIEQQNPEWKDLAEEWFN